MRRRSRSPQRGRSPTRRRSRSPQRGRSPVRRARRIVGSRPLSTRRIASPTQITLSRSPSFQENIFQESDSMPTFLLPDDDIPAIPTLLRSRHLSPTRQRSPVGRNSVLVPRLNPHSLAFSVTTPQPQGAGQSQQIIDMLNAPREPIAFRTMPLSFSRLVPQSAEETERLNEEALDLALGRLDRFIPGSRRFRF